mmetsp:Transcript_81279/g.225845  ORF Transcript_81279/g.225845 Transcript_81279/m.225845 type:complete len:293 (+) Transcript_81279:128-1006(+)
MARDRGSPDAAGASEHEIGVLLVVQHARSVDRLDERGVRGLLQALLLDLRLLLLHDLLHAEELLAGLLVHLLCDVLHDLLDAGDQDVLQRVDSTAGHLDLLIEGLEGRLQGGQVDEVRDGLQVHVLARADDGSAMRHAQGLRGGVDGRVVDHLEDGDADAGNVVRLEPARHRRLLRPLKDSGGDVVAGVGPLSLGVGEGRVLEAVADLQLRVDDVLEQGLELGLQRVALLLQQGVPLLRAAQAGLERLQGHPVGRRLLSAGRHGGSRLCARGSQRGEEPRAARATTARAKMT